MIKPSFTVLFSLCFAAVTTAQIVPFCTGTTNGFVVDFALFQNEVHTTGFFTTVCSKSTSHVARWNGTQWVQAAQGGIDEGHALEVIDDVLYITTYEFGTDSNYVVRWNGSQLTTIGTVYRTNPNPDAGQNSSIYDILPYGGDIVISGEFNRVAGQTMPGIARWNGVQWDSLGSGLSGSIAGTPAVMYPHQLEIFDGDLVVCGNFAKAGGQTVNGIARWDGTSWSAFGEGFNGSVYGVGVFNGVLYAGGSFTASGSTPLGNIARWNGTAWEDPGFGVQYSIAGVQAFVHTIKPIGDSLFIAGGFNRLALTAGPTLNVSGVVVLNSSQQINTLGGGPAGKEIEAVMAYNGGILIGGGANTSSGYIGFWNPATTGLETLYDDSRPHLSPNPATDRLQLAGCADCDYTRLRLTDASGRVCFETDAVQEGPSVELPLLPAGLYIAAFSGSQTRAPYADKLVIAGE